MVSDAWTKDLSSLLFLHLPPALHPAPSAHHASSEAKPAQAKGPEELDVTKLRSKWLRTDVFNEQVIGRNGAVIGASASAAGDAVSLVVQLMSIRTVDRLQVIVDALGEEGRGKVACLDAIVRDCDGQVLGQVGHDGQRQGSSRKRAGFVDEQTDKVDGGREAWTDAERGREQQARLGRRHAFDGDQLQ